MNEEIIKALLRVMPFVILLAILLVAIRRKKIRAEEIGLKKPNSIKSYLFWVLGFLFLVLFVEIILYYFGLLVVDVWEHPLVATILRIAGAVLLAPLAEEIIFRGLILNLLRKKLPNLHLAVFVQALLFVLLHNFTYQLTFTSAISMAEGLLDAGLFAYARIYTGSLYTSISMHAIGNLVATVERFIF